MAAPTIDLSGLILLEQAIASMQATQAATPSTFVGGTAFNATYKSGTALNPISGPATMTTAQLQQRLSALRLAFDTLAL